MGHTHDAPRLASIRTPARHRWLLATTTAFIALTVLLGVSTRAAGAGLACNANWPLCDGGLLNLFPATIPSAYEWIHRVVAGVTGLLVVASTLSAWQTPRRPQRWLTTIGLGLLPLQVLLGRETVVSFAPPILALHFWTAMAIFLAFTAATLAAWRDRLAHKHLTAALISVLVSLPLTVVLGPPFVTRYTPVVQAVQYSVILALFAATLLAADYARRTHPEIGPRALTTGLFGLSLVSVYLGRQRIPHPELAPIHAAVVGLTALAFLGTLAWSRTTT